MFLKPCEQGQLVGQLILSHPAHLSLQQLVQLGKTGQLLQKEIQICNRINIENVLGSLMILPVYLKIILITNHNSWFVCLSPFLPCTERFFQTVLTRNRIYLVGLHFYLT